MGSNTNSITGAAYVTASPDAGVPVVDANLTPVEYGQSGLTAATVTYIWHATNPSIFGTSLPTGATVALVQCVGDDVRWTDDSGTTLTTTYGMLLAAGDQFWYTGDLDELRFIETGTACEMNITLYKQA
jgi:hypothetical protein